MTSRKDLMNEAFDALLVSTTVVGLSMVTKKLFGEKLVDQSSMKDIAKMTAGITGATMLVKYAQDKKWLPDNPFKTT